MRIWVPTGAQTLFLENGEFVDGIYLALVDAAVESNGAESTTIYDLNKDGHPRGRDEDKYAFRED